MQPKPAELGADAIKAALRAHQDDLRDRHGVVRFGLFGSYARGEQHSQSDIDLLVELAKPISLFKLIELENCLSDILGAEVDLAAPNRNALDSRIGRRILKEVQYID